MCAEYVSLSKKSVEKLEKPPEWSFCCSKQSCCFWEMEAFAVRLLFGKKLFHIFHQPANLTLYSWFANLLCCRFRCYLSYSRFMLHVRRQYRINVKPCGILGFNCKFLENEALQLDAWSVSTETVKIVLRVISVEFWYLHPFLKHLAKC